MTDRNIDRRLLFTLYMDLATKSMELKWAAEEWARTNTYWPGKELESTVEQHLRMESATLPVRQCVLRIQNLLLTPDTREPNSFTLDNALETDVRLLGNYRSALSGTYEEICHAVDAYLARVFARISQLYLSLESGKDGKTLFGENFEMDLSEAMPVGNENGLMMDDISEESL